MNRSTFVVAKDKRSIFSGSVLYYLARISAELSLGWHPATEPKHFFVSKGQSFFCGGSGWFGLPRISAVLSLIWCPWHEPKYFCCGEGQAFYFRWFSLVWPVTHQRGVVFDLAPLA
ncbi:hypothetical protein [Thiothrix nivea]|uniref:hypothetical protein n=1 Tax=Thiothrix nivea TaxID=1031 RepID=UPI0005942AC7|nr:hypothetical protein [Thiothrix nivea]